MKTKISFSKILFIAILVALASFAIWTLFYKDNDQNINQSVTKEHKRSGLKKNRNLGANEGKKLGAKKRKNLEAKRHKNLGGKKHKNLNTNERKNISAKKRKNFVLKELVCFNKDKDTLLKIPVKITGPRKKEKILLTWNNINAKDSGKIHVYKKMKPFSFDENQSNKILDLIFVNRNHKIVFIQKNSTQVSYTGNVKMVIETNPGLCDKYKVEKGDYIQFNNLKEGLN